MKLIKAFTKALIFVYSDYNRQRLRPGTNVERRQPTFGHQAFPLMVGVTFSWCRIHTQVHVVSYSYLQEKRFNR